MPDFPSDLELTDRQAPGSNASTSASNNYSQKIPCRRCLIEGLDEAEVMAKLRAYIDAIEPTRRTPDDAYRQRLAVCDTCPQLVGGMCRLCGCFVLYRAAIIGNDCPDIPERWHHS